MVNKRVLIISPTPTHPTNAGNRVGVLNIVNYFIRNDCKIFFCYINLENYSHNDMLSYFDGNFKLIEKDFLRKRSIYHLFQKFISKLIRVKYWIKFKASLISENEWKYNTSLDGLVDRHTIKSVQQLSKQNWDIVVCEYVWISKLLTLFPKKTLKIIDTHDKFTNRFEIYNKMNIKPDWISLHAKEELEGLSRADLIITLNDNDTNYFKSKMNNRVCKFHFVPKINAVKQKKFSYTLLYLASDNLNNVSSITKFIKEVYPILKKEESQIKLLIGGSICDKLKVEEESIVLKGKIENPFDFYSLGDIAVNPEISGTGFKIKVMEAISYGIPVISSEIGRLGIESDDQIELINSILIAENAEQYLEHIRMLADVNYYSNMVLNSAEAISNMNIKLETNLKNTIIQLLDEKKDCHINKV